MVGRNLHSFSYVDFVTASQIFDTSADVAGLVDVSDVQVPRTRLTVWKVEEEINVAVSHVETQPEPTRCVVALCDDGVLVKKWRDITIPASANDHAIVRSWLTDADLVPPDDQPLVYFAVAATRDNLA